MNVAVWDTYVMKNNGVIMHFDIIVPAEIKDSEIVYAYGKKYLTSKGLSAQSLTAKECTFCHIESVKPLWESTIVENGYYIYEMENCN